MSLEQELEKLAINPEGDHSEFFPKSSRLTSLPSINKHESGLATSLALLVNHRKNHCFFNDKRHHNHLVHHVLALYSIGATPEAIKKAFENESGEQRPISPVKYFEFDHENWTDHLGKVEYYGNYLKFFGSEVSKKGSANAIEEYIFEQGAKGDLFNRSFAGLLHPIIHWSCGLEFGLDAIVAEGLAITAVHTTWMAGLKLSDLVEKASSKSGVNGKSSKSDFNGKSLKSRESDLESLLKEFGSVPQEKTYKPKSGLSSFEIISKIIQDKRIVPEKIGIDFRHRHYDRNSKSPELGHWLDQWKIEPDADDTEIAQRTKEIMWLVTVLFVASFEEDTKAYSISFFVVHLISVVVWATMGLPKLQLAEVMKDTENLKVPESQNPVKGESPWFKVLSSAARHPDEHVTKLVRTMDFASRFFGNTPKGYYSSSLEGTDLLDSSIFLRAAIMTLNKQDWDVQVTFRQFKWYPHPGWQVPQTNSES